MPGRAYDTVIMGGGPVGLATALVAARYGSVLVALPKRPPAAALRIDCVPVALLALFVELGLHPGELGASAVHDHRLVAWESANPEVVRGAGTGHILRPVLEERLLARVRAHRAISTVAGAPIGSLPPAGLILDATGRRAITAARTQLPANPGIVRAIVIRGAFSRAQQAFRLAGLPTGYAYRLGTASAVMVGLVQGRDQWRDGAGPLDERLRVAGVGWLVAGLRCGNAEKSIGGAASVQWSEGPGPAIRIGDSALARDALASQGIANGISAALTLFESAGFQEGYSARVNAERLAHLSSLERLIGDCMHREHSFWRDYRRFLREQLPAANDPAATAASPNNSPGCGMGAAGAA